MRPSASQVILFIAIILILTVPTFCFAAPSISSLSPTTGAVGASVTINGSGFGSTQGTSTVKFNGKVASVTSWSASAIVAIVPAGATTGNVVVTVSGAASNGKTFTVVAVPNITSLSPTSGPVGQSITVAGSGFGSTQGSGTIKFNGTTAVPTSWKSTQIKAPVPAGATSGNVVVHASGVDSNGEDFTVLPTPSITNLNPTSGEIGDSVTITGTNFGDTQGTSTVKFNGTTATPTDWTDTSIDVPVPSGATTGNVVVTVSGVASAGVNFTVIATPTISSLSPSSGAVGALVTIKGTNFQPTQGDSTVSFNGTAAVPTTWSATQIKALVPAGATSGYVVVTVFGLASNGKNFTINLPPVISSLSQTMGSIGMTITIYGRNFGWSQGSSTLKFNGIASTPSLWTETQITAPVPSGATTGPVIVHTSGVDSNGSNFTVDTLTSISMGPPNLSLPLGSKQRYTVTGTFSNGGQESLGSNATWTSDNTNIATVDPDGLLAAVGQGGPATIQASVGSLSSSANLNVIGSTFIQVDALPTGEGYYSTATLLPNGKVLIVGALPGLPNAYLYDPVSATFSPTGSLQTGRGWHTATLLDNGKVLIAGGFLLSSHVSVRTAELYDPDTGTFSVIGYMNNSRYGHTATLLKNGQVLLAAGGYLLQPGVGGPAPAELYDPVANTFSLTGDLSIPRSDATATLLNDGTVLVVGGFAQDGSTAAVERYNVATGTFTRTADLGTPRGDHTATLLGDGKVLVVGGACTSCTPTSLATAELYDPVAGSFSGTGSLSLAREFHTATLLSDGTVLVVGGGDVSVTLSTAERFDPATQTFTGAGSMINGRYGALATLLNDGRVLIAGGTGMTGDEIAELYAPTPPPPSSLQITPSSVTMIVGETRQFTVIDNNGHPRSDATWSLSDEGLATITSDNSPMLTAIAPGNLTLTASVQGVTAQAQISILEVGTVLDPGTPYWSVSSTPGFIPTQIAQAVPTEEGPDLYSVETSSDGKTTLLHALTADGRQLWQSQLPALTNKSVPDGSGGLLVTEHTTCDPGQTDPMTVADIDAKTGKPLWQVKASGIQRGQSLFYCYSPDMAPQIAVQPDGIVVMSAPTNSGMPPLITVWRGSVGSTLIPTSSITDSGGAVYFVQSLVGPPTVAPDGAAYVEYQVRDSGVNKVNSAALYLLTPGATPILLMTNTDLNSGRFPEPTDSSLLPGRIIPDGQGGLIASWTILPSNLPFPR